MCVVFIVELLDLAMNLGGVIIPDIGLPSGYTFVGVLDEIYPMIRCVFNLIESS